MLVATGNLIVQWRFNTGMKVLLMTGAVKTERELDRSLARVLVPPQMWFGHWISFMGIRPGSLAVWCTVCLDLQHKTCSWITLFALSVPHSHWLPINYPVERCNVSNFRTSLLRKCPKSVRQQSSAPYTITKHPDNLACFIGKAVQTQFLVN